jgi:hypothetical protein
MHSNPAGGWFHMYATPLRGAVVFQTYASALPATYCPAVYAWYTSSKTYSFATVRRGAKQSTASRNSPPGAKSESRERMRRGS